MLRNQKPAYIVTQPALTSLHTSQILTLEEFDEAQCVWGEYAFAYDRYNEELYSKLFSEYVILLSIYITTLLLLKWLT